MEAIVLGRKDIREADQIITIYTKDRGKLDLFARGVKKITSKNTSHLEPCSLVHITTEQGKAGSEYLIRVQSLNYFSAIRSDVRKSIVAQYISSLTNSLTLENEPDSRIYQLLKSYLTLLEHMGDVPLHFIDAFTIKLLQLLGFTPIVDKCVVSGESFSDLARVELTKGPQCGFYFAGGGIVSPRVKKQKREVGERVLDCGLKEVSDLAFLLKANLRTIPSFELTEEEQDKLHTLVHEYLLFHTEKNIANPRAFLQLTQE